VAALCLTSCATKTKPKDAVRNAAIYSNLELTKLNGSEDLS
jgi:hypothetical protein